MYRRQNALDVADQFQLTNCDGQELGFSLKPPEWLRSAFRTVIAGQTVTVQTAAGPQTIRLDDPHIASRVISAMRPQVTDGTPAQPTLVERVEQAVPGGMGTIAIAAGAGLLLLLLMGRRRG